MLGTDDNTTILKTLTSTLNDSVNGYREAAEHAEGSQFQQIFRDNAGERERVAGELAGEVRRLGGTPDEDGTVLGKTHQAFLDLKAAVLGRDDKAIVNEVERGEDYLKEKFEAALSDDKLTPESREIVERAYQSVRKGHDQISQLKHGMEA
ncbi:PA2169 family four-helix-bundle protein [Sphingomonas sp.]|uniref:ferritin-like domain-containing protein n=1 Tax=Sphingomonas sp. TaxID=28214 RepID=UPI00286D2129|nr:PA2169 family four-helix-bundle protein [Sphingomonas sp.]